MFKEKIKGRLREKTLSLFVWCLCLLIVFAVCSVASVSNCKIKEADYKDAGYEYDTAKYRYGSSWKTAKQQELYDAKLHYNWAKTEYYGSNVLKVISFTGCGLFFVLTIMMIVWFFRKKYPEMSDKEKYYFKRAVFKTGLVCAVIGLIVSITLLIFSVSRLVPIDEYSTDEETALYGVYTLYMIISACGICVSAGALSGYAFLFGLDVILQKNALSFGMQFANQKKTEAIKTSGAEQLSESESLIQDETEI